MALDAAGFPVIGYYDAVNLDLKVVHCGDAACTSANIITTVDGAGWVGMYPSLVLDASGFPVISYYDHSNGDLKVVRCGDAACTSANTIRTVDSLGDVGWHTSLALDARGFPVISYYDHTNGNLKVAHCSDPTCSGVVSPTVDSVGQVGEFTSLVLDASGFPVVSYYGASDLKVVHCGNPNCTAGNAVSIVDSAGIVGWDTSLVLDASGFPVISYWDETNGDLKVARCGNAACGAGNVITSVDSAGVVGEDTSLVLDAAGHPVIAYYDTTNADLKLAALVG
jgi:hypothetical protein